ncbi:DUF2500 domain-containing protein [Vibrio sp. SM6]|uniref:DUF2500 domain-containing protein n=1 Tax=Vibrio agarilyticus TaxID=2726741 RepID=A0A7X8TRP7_9VIBR|nr:DUF2500 domain-containing protein [Vibrio agarilyticus]NLS13640.1 DUF2500 domain-containing protein [Vibrio agarilyticus]
MPVTLIAALAALALIAGWAAIGFHRKHLLGENAPEQQVNVTILDKQAIDLDESSGQDNQEYWIYVQRGTLGPKREFQVGIHYYQALNPGDKGILTYQGNRFVHFALQR